jgi:hypothetical protein
LARRAHQRTPRKRLRQQRKTKTFAAMFAAGVCCGTGVLAFAH